MRRLYETPVTRPNPTRRSSRATRHGTFLAAWNAARRDPDEPAAECSPPGRRAAIVRLARVLATGGTRYESDSARRGFVRIAGMFERYADAEDAARGATRAAA
jgi:hypothetical protein